MGNKLNKKKKKKTLEIKDDYKYLENFEEEIDLKDRDKEEKEFINYQQDIDFSKKMQIITKYKIQNDIYDSLILNDGKIARIIDNSLIIYNKNNFKSIISIKAKSEIYNLYQLQNGKIIIVFEHFFIIYKLEKDKLILLQKTKFDNFEYDIYKYVKMLDKNNSKSYYSPEVIELSNKSFIIKFLTKEYPTEKRPYTDYDSPELIVNIYEYNKIAKKYIFKNSVGQSIGEVSRILKTFIVHNGYDSVYIYRNNGLKQFIEGRFDPYDTTSKYKHYIWKNEYFIFKTNSKIEIYEFDNDYKEKKIKEIEGAFFPMRDCILYYKENNPLFFYTNYSIKNDVKLIQYNENFEESEKIINDENKEIIKKIKEIKEIKIINNKIYIISKNCIYIYILINN
jgi:hypothetical protein